MMLKIADSWDYGFDVPVNYLVKTAGDGRIKGHDRDRFLKYAGEEGLARFQRAQLRPGEVPSIQIALGCTEMFGPNRNADGFRKRACQDQHSTFVKLAKAYRDHSNGKTSPSYGRVVDSWFNNDRGRIELLVGLNSTKSAAEANDPEHGRVADLELEALEKRGSYPVSMSSLVPYDQCSSCGHKAKSRSEYCTGSMCKHGGLKRNLGRIMDDGHHLHADNPKNNWVDISHITKGRQADRIAYSLGKLAAEDGMKSAADSGYVDPAEYQFILPGSYLVPYVSELRTLADRELMKSASDLRLKQAYDPRVYCIQSPAPSGTTLGQACSGAAEAGFLLPLESFLDLASAGAEKYAADVRHFMPRAFSSLLSDPDLDQRISRAHTALRTQVPNTVRDWAVKEAQVLGNNIEAIRKRITIVNLYPDPAFSKSAAVALPPALDLAKEYAAYAVVYRVQGLNKNAGTEVDVTRLLSLNNV